MIKLTELGKKVYGDRDIDFRVQDSRLIYVFIKYCHAGGANQDGTPKLKEWCIEIFASNPLELKALIDMKLIEITEE